MPEQLVNIGVFVFTQICIGLVVVTKLQAGGLALRQDLNKLTSVVDGLTSAMVNISLSDVKVDGRIANVEGRLAVVEATTSRHTANLVGVREKYHSLSGFLQATYPGWTEIERSRIIKTEE